MDQPARRGIGAVIVVLASSWILTACSEPLPPSAAKTEAPAGCTKDLLACARRSMLAPYVPTKATKATGTPIRLGMVNQENTAAGSYPELSQAVAAATEFINTELGGVDGRPIEVEVCNTEFSTEGSTSCGQGFVEQEVPAVLGGIDVFGNAIDTLAENEIPYVGGIPISPQSVESPNSFQWSGGGWGATVAFSWFAAEELGAEKVAIVYGDFGSIADGARAGQEVLQAAGVADVAMVPFPVITTDMASPLQAAMATDPDAIIILAADAACKAAFDASNAMGISAAMFYTGACAAPTITEAAGNEATEGAYFSVEGAVNRENPDADNQLYTSVMAAYAPELDPIGVATVSARSMMNLFSVLSLTKPEQVDAESITALLRSQRNTPSFMGHDYTCDGKQFPGLPAACSPQQILVRMQDGQLEQVGGWIDVGAANG